MENSTQIEGGFATLLARADALAENRQITAEVPKQTIDFQTLLNNAEAFLPKSPTKEILDPRVDKATDQILKLMKKGFSFEQASKQLADLGRKGETKSKKRFSKKSKLLGIGLGLTALAATSGVAAASAEFGPKHTLNLLKQAPAVAAAFVSPHPLPKDANPSLTAQLVVENPTLENKNMFKDILGSYLLKKAEQVRTQRDVSEPSWRESVDSQLMKDSVGILFSVKGSEDRWGEDDRDSIIAMAYYPKENRIDAVSLNRDIADPITTRAAVDKGEKITQYQELMKAGRFGVLKKSVEAQTGLAADLDLTLTRGAVVKIVNNVFGKLEVDVPEEIPVDQYNIGFHEGKQMMDGNKLAQYLMTRTSTSVESRMGRQNNIIPLLIDETVNRLKDNLKSPSGMKKNLDMLSNLEHTLDKLKADGELETNLDYHQMIDNMEENLPEIVSGLKNQPNYFERPKLNGMVVDANIDAMKDPNDTDPRHALHTYIDPQTNDLLRFDVNDPETFTQYYTPIRQKIASWVLKSK